MRSEGERPEPTKHRLPARTQMIAELTPIPNCLNEGRDLMKVWVKSLATRRWKPNTGSTGGTPGRTVTDVVVFDKNKSPRTTSSYATGGGVLTGKRGEKGGQVWLSKINTLNSSTTRYSEDGVVVLKLVRSINLNDPPITTGNKKRMR